MGLNDFLNTLVFWKIIQFHALAARQPLAPVLGLSQNNPAPLLDNYSPTWTQEKMPIDSLVFLIEYILREICLFQGLGVPISSVVPR
jgi:hypothetical protein